MMKMAGIATAKVNGKFVWNTILLFIISQDWQWSMNKTIKIAKINTNFGQYLT